MLAGELVAAAGGLGLLVAGFLPWYSAGGEDATAWQAFSVVDIVLAATAVVGISVALVALLRLSVSYPPAGAAVATGFGALALILVVYRLIDPPVADASREIGAWLGLLAAAAVTAGGYLGMQESSSVPAGSAA